MSVDPASSDALVGDGATAAQAGSACPACGSAVQAGALFCEACGAKVGAGEAPGPLDAPVTATDEDSPVSAPTHVHLKVTDPAGPATAGSRACLQCGGVVGADGYCESCGVLAPSERDHFEEAPAPWVAGVCDRGIVHGRNEDAMALFVQGQRAVLVVCDGVSSSVDSDVASLAGARAARDLLRLPFPAGIGTPESADAAAARVLTEAAAAANAAVVAHTDSASTNPASCTFVVGTVDGRQLRYAVIGDSRAYWLPDVGTPVQLTTDDSMASLLIAGGMSRAEAEVAPQAHAITKWLGRDAPDIVPVCGSLAVDGPGWLLVCSDGLWNYASEATDLRDRIAASTSTEPLPIAGELVAFANAQGGRDNITAALARVS